MMPTTAERLREGRLFVCPRSLKPSERLRLAAKPGTLIIRLWNRSWLNSSNSVSITAVAVGFGNEVEVANMAQLWLVAALLFVGFGPWRNAFDRQRRFQRVHGRIGAVTPIHLRRAHLPEPAPALLLR